MQRPNILTIISHDLGRYLGCYGVPHVRSPRIDDLAKEGLVIENAFCVAPQCSPSRAAMWTGRYPHANGVVGLCHGPHANDLNPGETHLASILQNAGYTTWLHGPQHESRQPETLGFDYLNQDREADQIAANFEAHFAEYDGDRPFFAEICFFEPHRPFPRSEDIEVPNPEDVWIPPYLPPIDIVKEDMAKFEASVATMDRAIGRILDAVEAGGHLDNTIVIVTADHGIPFPLAKMTLRDAGLEIPMIVKIPGGVKGQTSPALYTNVDFTPSLLALLDIPLPEQPPLQGVALPAVLTGEDRSGRDKVYGEKTFHTYYDPMRCVRTREWKFIANFENAPQQETSPDYGNNGHGYPEVAKVLEIKGTHPPYELYDLANDPQESKNLAADPAHAETVAALKSDLLAWMQETGDPLLQGPIPSGTYLSRLRDFQKS